ncbi:hypothetical protein T265_06851 [Opisthorchis viverrini]|uniref:Uncharacterized protein n=1 Tax=Opisthorchis viverrini TaxID=6198 RepID=A0A075AD01_OPIVI|nr:hypothetical protein T265_06851 [Opisthorchis viverrini]KER25749.1 hypothetical protein T265_06851 [Opisthorchis viverrini]
MLPLKLKAILFVTAISTSFQFGFHTGVINAPYQVVDFVSLPSVQLISDFIGNVTADRHGSADEAYEKGDSSPISPLCPRLYFHHGLPSSQILRNHHCWQTSCGCCLWYVLHCQYLY